MSLYLTIAGVDRCRGYYVPGTGRIVQSKNSRYSASFTVLDKAQLWKPSKYERVTFGDAGVGFRGLIDRVVEKRDSNARNSYLRYECTCVDRSVVFDRRHVWRRYPSGSSFYNIIADIMTSTLSGEGITMNHVDGFGAISDELVFDGRTVMECFNTIRDLSGEEFWLLDDDLWFKNPVSAIAAPFAISDSPASRNWRDLDVEYGTFPTPNRVYVRSGVQLASGSYTDTHTGDGVLYYFTTRFALTEAPIVKVNGVTQTVYELGVDAFSQDGYYWTRNGYSVFHGLNTPLSAGATLEIIYGSYSSNVVYAEDAAEIASRAAIEGGTGIEEIIVDARDIENQATAEALAAGILAIRKAIPKTIRYTTLNGGLRPGMQQTVALTKNGIAAPFYVAQVESEALQIVRGMVPRQTWETITTTWEGEPGVWDGGATWETLGNTWDAEGQSWDDAVVGRLFFVHRVTLTSGYNQGVDGVAFWENLYGKIKGIDYSSVVAQVDDGYYQITIVSNNAAVDLANGRNQQITLNQATQVTVQNPTLTGGSGLKSGDWFVLYVDQDGTGGRPKPAFGSAFASDVSVQEIDGTPNTRTTYQFTYHGSKWSLDSFRTGGAIT